MKALRELGIILGVLFAAHIIQSITKLPIPSAVLGMFILLILLLTGIVKVEMVEGVSNFLLKYLTFFFLPAGIGIMTEFDLIKDIWVKFLLISLISTALVIAITGLVSQGLLKRKEKK